MYFFIDTETGGLRPGKHSLLEVGLAAYENGKILDWIVLPVKHTEYLVTGGAMGVNHIDLANLDKNGYVPGAAVTRLIDWVKDINIRYPSMQKPILIGHNVDFDRRFLQALFDSVGEDLDHYINYHTMDTAGLLRFMKEVGLLPVDFPIQLHKAARAFGFQPKDEHTSFGDILTTIYVFEQLVGLMGGLHDQTNHGLEARQKNA